MSWIHRKKIVYFMRPVGRSGPIKIGCSAHTEDRLTAMSNWSPFPLEIIASAEGTHQMERFLHRKYSDYRSHSEWFWPTPDMLEGIRRVNSGESLEAAFRAMPDPADVSYSPRYLDAQETAA